MKKSKAGEPSSRSGGGGLLVVFVLAVVAFAAVVFGGAGGVAVAEAGPERVYDTRFVPLKLDLSGNKPEIKQDASFSVLVGKSRKKASWVKVNPWRYVGCDVGDAWLDGACVSVRSSSPALVWSPRLVTMVSLAGAMVLVGLLWLLGGRRERV